MLGERDSYPRNRVQSYGERKALKEVDVYRSQYTRLTL